MSDDVVELCLDPFRDIRETQRSNCWVINEEAIITQQKAHRGTI